MGNVIELKEVEEKIINLRGQNVILDSDVAELYGVETKRINEAVSNNSNKFPEGYIFSLDEKEWNSLRSKISTLNVNGSRGQHTKYIPSVFTEKGLYMLATILKSKKATETTIAIVETFTKMREFARVINQLPEVADESKQKSLMQRTGEILAEILDDNALEVSDDETTIELNLAVMKVKHTTRRNRRIK